MWSNTFVSQCNIAQETRLVASKAQNCNFVCEQNRPDTNAPKRRGATRCKKNHNLGKKKEQVRAKMFRKESIVPSRPPYTYEMRDKGLVSA